MKKYVKPELFYEHYELSQHIADCAWELTTLKMDCKETGAATADPLKLPGFPNLFVSEVNGCVLLEAYYQDFCYHGGAGGVNVFNS